MRLHTAAETEKLRLELESRMNELNDLKLREQTLYEELEWRRLDEKVWGGRGGEEGVGRHVE